MLAHRSTDVVNVHTGEVLARFAVDAEPAAWRFAQAVNAVAGRRVATVADFFAAA